MKEFFSALWKDYMLSAIITVLAGLLITVFYSVAIDAVCIGLGLIITVLGGISIAKYLKEASSENRYSLLIGLVLCAVGIYFIVDPRVLQNIVAVAIGIIIIYHGIIDLQCTASLRKSNYKYWYVSLVFSLLILASGIVLIIIKNQAIQTLALLVGIMLIAEGLINVWIAVKVKKFNG